MAEDKLLLRIDLQLFADEKTEEATPHRKQEARKKGQVAKSTDLNAALVLLVSMVMIFVLRNYFLENTGGFATLLLGHWLAQPLSQENLWHLVTELFSTYFKVMAPVFLVAMAIGVAANVGQVGFKIAPESIQPKLSHLNPLQGFKRMFSRRALVELVKSLLKIVIVGFISYSILRGGVETLFFLVDMSVFESVEVIAGLTFKIGMGVIAAFLAIAVLDYIFQRKEFEKSIRMSKQEVKEEFKQMEGDPLLKAKLREKQRQLALHRMMHSVPEATVIVTNPTHLAVALKYEVESPEGAPLVLAKGAGVIAERIKNKAREHDIPIIEDKPVAQFIYKNVEIGQEIPPELYQSVAEILAMLYRMRGKI
ncbi:MAG: flagellar biosynthesis protein FlhB [Clostridia bacterium]|jgi:flagellar biosynthetic protein FlhB|nr:flagellar biosynthesis protein FlhB [Clostridia bacterium]